MSIFKFFKKYFKINIEKKIMNKSPRNLMLLIYLINLSKLRNRKLIKICNIIAQNNGNKIIKLY